MKSFLSGLLRPEKPNSKNCRHVGGHVILSSMSKVHHHCFLHLVQTPTDQELHFWPITIEKCPSFMTGGLLHRSVNRPWLCSLPTPQPFLTIGLACELSPPVLSSNPQWLPFQVEVPELEMQKLYESKGDHIRPRNRVHYSTWNNIWTWYQCPGRFLGLSYCFQVQLVTCWHLYVFLFYSEVHIL